MADNDPIQELQQLVNSGALDSDPQVKQMAIARIAAARAPVAGPAPVGPSPTLGAFSPQPVVTTRLMRKGMDEMKRAAEGSKEKLPTAYIPTDVKSDFPILHSEPSGASGEEADAAWKQRMADADKRGQKVYRLKDEFPVSPEAMLDPNRPLSEKARAALVRLGTDVIMPTMMRADESMTGGVATKGGIRGLEKAGVVPEGTLRDTMANVEASPVAGAIGTVAGAMNPKGLSGLVARGANALVSPVMKGVAGKALGYAASGALSGGLTNTAAAGVDQLTGGKRDPLKELPRAAGAGAAAGLVFGGLGELGRNRTAALRDPEVSKEATDLALAENAGVKTSFWSGVRPSKTPEGQAFRKTLDDMKPEAREKGIGLDAIAADKASRQLGGELASYQDEVLSSVDRGNQAVYAQGQMVSTEPLVRKNMELLRKATHPDGGELPGHSVASLGREMNRMARVEVVPASSDAAHAAEPEMVIQAGQAAALKIISKSQAKPGHVAIIRPINVSAEQLDDINQMYASRVSQGEWSPAEAPIKGLQAAGLQTRGRLGSGVEKMKAEQAAALNEMNNSLVAAGLPRATKVDLSSQETKNALFNAVRGWKAGNTKPNDDVLGRVAARSQSTKTAMDEAAAVGAYQRLRGQATPNVAMGPSGTVRPWGMMGAAKLHLDPVFGAFGRMGEKFPGLPSAASSEAARRKK